MCSLVQMKIIINLMRKPERENGKDLNDVTEKSEYL